MFFSSLFALAQTALPVAVPESALPAASAVAAAPQFSIWSHILHSDPLVKLTLLLLISFSVACWAVIFYKYKQLRSAQKSAENFWQRFSAMTSLAEATSMKGLRDGPVYEIFLSGQESLGKMKKATNQFSTYHRDYLEQRLRQTQGEEIDKLEQYVSFLATTASVAPFIGLFGTVWGILTAFLAIGNAGSSSLATVGPFIAEALVATAVGLFAAIPAVVAYNYFVGKIRAISKTVELFVEDFMLKCEREF